MSTPLTAELFAEVAIKFSEAIHDIASLIATRANVPFEPEYLKPKETPKDGKKKRIVDPNFPKRPPSAYLLFSAHVRKTNPTETLTVKDISSLWSEMKEEQKASYEKAAGVALDKWRKEVEEYRAANGTPAVEATDNEEEEEETPAPKRTKVASPVIAPVVAPVVEETAAKKDKKERKPKADKPAAVAAEVPAPVATEEKKKKEKKEKKQ